MKKILCGVVFALMFVLTGCTKLTECTKLIGTETSTVQVKITDAHYEETQLTYYYSIGSGTMVPHFNPPVYKITVEYDGTEYIVSGQHTYEKYSDSIGKYANGTLETRKYDDGSVMYKIVGLEY